ncbi:hypothetical protein F2Q69_00049196 [Brassica cretica]|uniref:Uncharacterized protein n=1 Tax=Brassica cretica TaxID=69181 RepID=A0A8S9Q041_BRACR|nr:hypothetical protein F2Q69_00049196 [Brassica cretica]
MLVFLENEICRWRNLGRIWWSSSTSGDTKRGGGAWWWRLAPPSRSGLDLLRSENVGVSEVKSRSQVRFSSLESWRFTASLPMALSASECSVPRRQALRLAIDLARARVASLGVWSLAVFAVRYGRLWPSRGRPGAVLSTSLSSVFPARCPESTSGELAVVSCSPSSPSSCISSVLVRSSTLTLGVSQVVDRSSGETLICVSALFREGTRDAVVGLISVKSASLAAFLWQGHVTGHDKPNLFWSFIVSLSVSRKPVLIRIRYWKTTRENSSVILSLVCMLLVAGEADMMAPEDQSLRRHQTETLWYTSPK